MSYRFVKVEREGPITLVTINRPEVMNALHPPAQQEMEKVFDDFQNDSQQWIAIVTGAGDKAFSAGNDLKFQAEHGSAAVRDGLQGVKGGFGGLHRRTDLYKPVIAAVNGFALGGGFEIVLSCDIIIAAEHATFGLPEPRVGLMAGAGGVHRLPRQIPYHIAMGMMLTGRRVTARDAERYGLVNEVVPAANLLATARKWAGEILECAPLSIRASKEAAVEGLGMTLPAALDHRFAGSAKMAASADYIEGPRAFAEKRKPNWTGA
ncbi:MAG TPA: enoyl-CoA hydratase-related protein [Thermoanaerobaculia bacterium]|jgi:crotonobetainyl-CoA hydratase|nr:enoyl-CoA hydratase-related protein [Thermoanaerobaculia bacterium]